MLPFISNPESGPFFLIIQSLIIVIFGLTAGVGYLRARLGRAEMLKKLDERNKVFSATSALNQIILTSLEFSELAQKIANGIPQFLGYKTGVLAVVDQKRGVLKRVAISETSGGSAALQSLEIPFTSIEIGLNEVDNLCIKALRENKTLSTNSLYDVLRPVVSQENSAKVQGMMGTKTTLIYPIYSLRTKEPLGIFLVSMDKLETELTDYERQTISNFVDGVRIALGNASLYTSLKETTDKLEIANQKLQELDKLKDDFVSIASHELRTPMTAIRSYAWMALNRSDVPISDKLKKYLIRVLLSTERLINLVNDMLNISRIESGRIEINPEPLDLISLIRDIIDEVYFSKSTEKNFQFLILEKPIPKVFADPEKLRQVLFNLVGNALKFSPVGGKIVFDFFTDGKFLETSVKDNGPGISREDLSKLFHKFSRLDNSYTAVSTSGGTGLGLYISKNLIELMHGRIWATSEGVGRGATLTFSLPVATPEILSHAKDFVVKPKIEIKGLV